MNQKASRRVSWRSHRRLCSVLFAFATACFGMGVVLLGLYGYRRQGVMLWLGIIYILLACLAFGIRGILRYMDDLHRRRRFVQVEKGVPNL